jgi:hypothetical protein
MKEEDGVEILQVRPGCELVVPGTGQRFILLYKTAGSAVVAAKKKVACFGSQVTVDETQRVSLGTRVVVEKGPADGFDPSKYFATHEQRAEKGRRKRREPGAERPKTAKSAPAPLKVDGNGVPEYVGPYDMVEDLLVKGMSSGQVFDLVKQAFPDYKGSKDSIASKKSHLKKAGRLK